MMEQIMKLFAPDGGFEEGPVYWNYATIYNVLYLSALDTALGNDFGLSHSQGFAETGSYRIQSIGPTRKSANFGDAEEEVFPSPQMFWLAKKFNRPEYALHERDLASALGNKMSPTTAWESGRFSIFALFWGTASLGAHSDSELTLVHRFTRINQVFLRSSWADSNAWYVGLKGGDAKASHGHLDLGSFVLDALGQRWAIDLGPDNYGLPGYFGPQRWELLPHAQRRTQYTHHRWEQ
ncbi:heparinase II/III family protein [Edaphobacter flagellatus]|uniref:heparinase II/III family protein n=1 Tax=Edaphobacter flagellatus TaxID=1933044 RepID=UPI0021B2D8D5|nr:heparinase II/III family protein [Edaphobacter flagellatus]